MWWCCCGTSSLVPIYVGNLTQDTDSFNYNVNYYEVGTPTAYPVKAISSYFHEWGPFSPSPGRLEQRGNVFEFAIGAITSPVSSATFTFLGTSGAFPAGTPEPDQTLQYFVFDKSDTFTSGLTTLISVADLGTGSSDSSQPASPGWGAGTNITSPDLASLINNVLASSGWNVSTSQIMICFFSKTIDGYVNNISSSPDTSYRYNEDQELNIT